MTRILLSFREESESTTINDTTINNTSDNTITTSSNDLEIIDTRNYETQVSSNIDISFEALELRFDNLIQLQEVNQNRLEELIVLNKQNVDINLTFLSLVIFLVVMLVIYKFTTI